MYVKNMWLTLLMFGLIHLLVYVVSK